jgi:hypothetical protein
MRATGVEAETGCVAKVEGCCQCFRIVLGEGVEEFGVHGSKRLTIVSPFLQSFCDGCGTTNARRRRFSEERLESALYRDVKLLDLAQGGL